MFAGRGLHRCGGWCKGRHGIPGHVSKGILCMSFCGALIHRITFAGQPYSAQPGMQVCVLLRVARPLIGAAEQPAVPSTGWRVLPLVLLRGAHRYFVSYCVQVQRRLHTNKQHGVWGYDAAAASLCAAAGWDIAAHMFEVGIVQLRATHAKTVWSSPSTGCCVCGPVS